MALTKLDSLMRWLDNGWHVILWANPMGSYSAALVSREAFAGIDDDDNDQQIVDCDENHITDDFTPTKVLERLADKPIMLNQSKG